MAARKQPQNNYRTMDNGVVLSDHAGMHYSPKTHICQQILSLRAQQISEVFDGAQGSMLIEGIRYAMIEELDACIHQLSGWREIAAMVKGRDNYVKAM